METTTFRLVSGIPSALRYFPGLETFGSDAKAWGENGDRRSAIKCQERRRRESRLLEGVVSSSWGFWGWVGWGWGVDMVGYVEMFVPVRVWICSFLSARGGPWRHALLHCKKHQGYVVLLLLRERKANLIRRETNNEIAQETRETLAKKNLDLSCNGPYTSLKY